jgi:hypothetical protein
MGGHTSSGFRAGISTARWVSHSQAGHPALHRVCGPALTIKIRQAAGDMGNAAELKDGC